MSSLSDLRALIVTHDPWLSTTFRELSSEFGIDAQTRSSQGVLEELGRERFEAVLLDFDTVSETTPILTTLRGIPSNKTAVVLAVATGVERKRHAFDSGANFVFERPLKVDELRRTLDTAYGLMQGERRRYFRCAVNFPVLLSIGLEKRLDCTSLNISNSGIALRTPTPLNAGEKVQLDFALPNGDEIRAIGVVVWDDKHGKSGLQLQCAKPEMRDRLDRWLDSQFEAQPAGRRI